LYTEKSDEDLRHSIEFIMRVKPYTEQDLKRKDYLTFIRILKESEAQEAQAVARLEEQSK
jgi:hypothetical protein